MGGAIRKLVERKTISLKEACQPSKEKPKEHFLPLLKPALKLKKIKKRTVRKVVEENLNQREECFKKEEAPHLIKDNFCNKLQKQTVSKIYLESIIFSNKTKRKRKI